MATKKAPEKKTAVKKPSTVKSTTTKKSPASAVKTDSRGFMDEYNNQYSYIYKNERKFTERQREQCEKAVAEFDRKIQTSPKFIEEVSKFNASRGDYLSSEREIAAYMFARKNAAKKKK